MKKTLATSLTLLTLSMLAIPSFAATTTVTPTKNLTVNKVTALPDLAHATTATKAASTTAKTTATPVKPTATAAKTATTGKTTTTKSSVSNTAQAAKTTAKALPKAVATTAMAAPTASATTTTETETGIDNDYSSGAAVAGATSEVAAATTPEKTATVANTDPTAVGNTAVTTTRLNTVNLSDYAKAVNEATWRPDMNVNSATTLKLQALLDWNHASPGPIDGGWGMNSKKALRNFQQMNNLPVDGHMSQKVWDAMTKNIPADQPVLVGYTITQQDVDGPYVATPAGSEAKSKMKGLYYQTIQEMLGERFHMDVKYLEKLNPNKTYKVGETITVFNPGAPLNEKITRIVAVKAENALYAYNGDRLIATYPTTVGSSDTPSPTGTYKIVNRVKNPWYKATQGEGKDKQVFMLPPGPNGPVGVVWMGLNKPSYGIHGSPVPEGISRQASHGCVRLTNWDVLEVFANVDTGTSVELK